MKTSDRAKEIRAELKAMFPQVKFSIRSDNYSMGSDVIVRWTAGPTEKDVSNVVDCLDQDMKDCYDVNIKSKSNGVSYHRDIPKELWEATREEIVKHMEANNNTYATDYWAV